MKSDSVCSFLAIQVLAIIINIAAFMLDVSFVAFGLGVGIVLLLAKGMNRQ